MTVRAIVFDIGGVLEITPNLGLSERWEARIGLSAGQLNERLEPVWLGGAIGAITLSQVHQGIRDALGVGEPIVAELMGDVWTEYLGTLNVELYDYFRALRPRYATGILSNSFVGAREREQAAYGFEDACDVIVYSHEVGMSKPDERIYQLTCAKLGVRPEETVFVDDNPPNIEAAQALGLKGVLFEGNAQTISEIEGHLA